jgi:hypothetical protein
MNNRTTSNLLTIIGAILIFIGIIAAFFGPLEIYCYYLFTEGGRFHYEGFGFGSFMFGNIAVQIMGYYIIALIFIPLGYGHLKKQSWIQKISLALLWSWFIVGIPLLLILLFIFTSTKEPTLFVVALSIVFLIISYTILPVLLIKFYQSKAVEVTLKLNENRFNAIRKYPIPILMTILLYLFYIFVFHVLLFYRGLFPFFGEWLMNLPGFIVITTSILFFALLILGTLKLRTWAWWASVIYFTGFAISTLITLFLSKLTAIVNLLKFPAKEANALINVPLQGFHLCIIFGIPVIVSAGVIIFSKKYFVGVRHPTQ